MHLKGSPEDLASRAHIEAEFPNIAGNYDITSEETSDYNCISWAADESEKWRCWWPSGEDPEVPCQHYIHTKLVYWPKGAPQTETIEGFMAAFATKGWKKCKNARFKRGYEKLVIYVDPATKEPTHAARELFEGEKSTHQWTSKLGDLSDVRHATLESIYCKEYGIAYAYMQRPRNRAKAGFWRKLLLELFRLKNN